MVGFDNIFLRIKIIILNCLNHNLGRIISYRNLNINLNLSFKLPQDVIFVIMF